MRSLINCTSHQIKLGGKIRNIREAIPVERMGDMRNDLRYSVKKIEKRIFGRPGLKWVYIIHMDLVETGHILSTEP